MKELQVLTSALDAANKAGVFNLQDAGAILQAINALGNKLQGYENAQNSAKDLPVNQEVVEPTAKKTVKKA